MRESIGATWIFSICLTFIVLFTAYLAISVNYAKAFRIKNHIISVIEQNEGFKNSAAESIGTYLVTQGYTATGNCPETISVEDGYYNSTQTEWQKTACINAYTTTEGTCNACVYRLTVDSRNDDLNACKSYYKVVTFFNFDIPVIRIFTKFSVKGDTKLIYDFANTNC